MGKFRGRAPLPIRNTGRPMADVSATRRCLNRSVILLGAYSDAASSSVRFVSASSWKPAAVSAALAPSSLSTIVMHC